MLGLSDPRWANWGEIPTFGIASRSLRGTEYKLPDKLAAIRIDNDLAVDSAEAEANKAMEVIIRKL